MDIGLNILLASLACAYIVRILLLEEKESHVGPFVLKSTFVYFQETKHIQPAALFDILRLLLGVYTVSHTKSGTLWTVRQLRAEVWECPKCLSFWVAIPFVLTLQFPAFMAYGFQGMEFDHIIINFLAIVCLSSIINLKLLD